ncbi:hypothetical protein BASA81_008621 [Batrachochytrium salamandrivorans]|nr:hypothetical protein BASA81_008621 [Batrachochytrium salamandrivorans]
MCLYLPQAGLKEEETTKFQTGGPDGDLGSNEIKISKDKTVAMLTAVVSSHKDSAFLLTRPMFAFPDGTVIESGIKFRNEFHLSHMSCADLFVPCGGRPESVDLNNVHLLFKEDGTTPRFKYIVEGANLFFTQEARLRLEKAGAVIFKDASANKGGVTSSSLEVLAALSSLRRVP